MNLDLHLSSRVDALEYRVQQLETNLNVVIAKLNESKINQFNETPSHSVKVVVGQALESEVKGNYKEIPVGVVGPNNEFIPYIQPNEMKAGEWSVQDNEWLFKFRDTKDNLIMASKAADTILNKVYNENGSIAHISDNYTYRYRPATQAEIIRYFPDEKLN